MPSQEPNPTASLQRKLYWRFRSPGLRTFSSLFSHLRFIYIIELHSYLIQSHSRQAPTIPKLNQNLIIFFQISIFHPFGPLATHELFITLTLCRLNPSVDAKNTLSVSERV